MCSIVIWWEKTHEKINSSVLSYHFPGALPTSRWFQPIWQNMLVKLDHFPNFWDENDEQIFRNHHLLGGSSQPFGPFGRGPHNPILRGRSNDHQVLGRSSYLAPHVEASSRLASCCATDVLSTGQPQWLQRLSRWCDVDGNSQPFRLDICAFSFWTSASKNKS